MIVDRTIKQDNLIPVLAVRLGFASDDENLADYITTSTPVTFTMRQRGTDSPKIDAAEATVVAVGANAVDVEYAWAAGDTDTLGLFFGEFEFTVDGKTVHAPTGSFISLRVIPRL